MHHGVFIGENTKNKKGKKILILGESHHISNTDKENMIFGKPASYTTESVVKGYIKNGVYKNSFRFFEKIGKSFGFNMKTETDRKRFWDNVYFGNYIDVLCGVKDNAAKKILQQENNGLSNREHYNDSLFTFINNEGIDVVVSFGRLVFNNLPSLNNEHYHDEDVGKIKDGMRAGKYTDYVGKCIYLKGIDHPHTTVKLKKDLEAYSLRHPSAYGYSSENYIDVLKKLI